MKSILETVAVKHFPKLPPETWAELRSELGQELLRFEQWTWPAPGDWPEALRFARSGNHDIPIDQLDLPKFAAEMARIQRWCTEVLIPRVRDESMKIEHEQSRYRAAIEEEAQAILLAGIARTSRNELLAWLPLAARMMALCQTVCTSPLILSPYLVTLPEGDYLAYADITIQDQLCLLAQIPREFPDMACPRYYVRGRFAEHHPVSITGVAYWLEDTMPVNDYAGIIRAMERIDEILLVGGDE